MKTKKIASKTKKTTPPERTQDTNKKEAVLTREEFFKTLDEVIQPVQAKPPMKEKKGTSE